MARGALLTGTAGGIIGAVTAGIGIEWSKVPLLLTNTITVLQGLNQLFYGALQFASFHVDLINFLQRIWPVYIYPFLVMTSRVALFSMISLILAVLFIVSGVLSGVGFYGVYKAGGGAMGLVGLIIGIIGGVAGGTLIILGNTLASFITFSTMPLLFSIPNHLVIWIGVIILALTFVVLGSASIAVRNSTAHPSAATAAGFLSILGACFLFPYILVSFGDIWALIGVGLMFVGFALIFVTFILWAVVFYSSRNIQSPGKT
nr:hypothetical protein [Candidatus Freyarchaeota archaeon]